MEYSIKVRTTGHHLSISTMCCIVGDIRKQLRLSIFDALVKEYPKISHTNITKLLEVHKIDLELKEAKKGSWELWIVGATSGAIAGIVATITSDLITSSDNYKKFKDKIYSISNKSAENASERLREKNKLGGLKVKEKKIKTISKPNNNKFLDIDTTLESEHKEEISAKDEEQINNLIKQLEERNKT